MGPNGAVGEYQFLSYKQVAEQVAQLASGMAAAGVQPQERVGVFGANSPEWMMAMQVWVARGENWGAEERARASTHPCAPARPRQELHQRLAARCCCCCSNTTTCRPATA